MPSAGEAGLGGYRPTLASRGLGSASRPCRVVDALAEHTRAPGPCTQLPLPSTLGAPLREEEGRHGPHLRRPKRSIINIRNNVDKTVYCSGPLRLPPSWGEVGMEWGGLGPPPGRPLFAQAEVFSSEGSLHAVAFVASATEISCLCYSLPQQDHLKPKTFIAPFKKGLYAISCIPVCSSSSCSGLLQL